MAERKPGLTRESDGRVSISERFKLEVQVLRKKSQLERKRMEQERLAREIEQSRLTQETKQEERDEFGTPEDVQTIYAVLAVEGKYADFLLLAEESRYAPSIETLAHVRAQIKKDESHPVEAFDYLVTGLAQLYLEKEDVRNLSDLLEGYPVRLEKDIFADYVEKQDFASLEVLTHAYGVDRFADILLESDGEIIKGLKEELRASGDNAKVKEMDDLIDRYGTGKLAVIRYQHENPAGGE